MADEKTNLELNAEPIIFLSPSHFHLI